MEAHYRPVANLPYLFKTIERVGAARLSAHVSGIISAQPVCVQAKSQRRDGLCWCECDILLNDILHAVDNQNIVTMLLLDLSAAFDTVDQTVMLHRLSHDAGVVQAALDWFRSVHSNGSTSPACPLTCG